MKIGEICAKTGLTKRAVRFYIECGLIDPEIVERNFREYRDYSERDAERLSVIAALRRAEFTLDQIKTMLDSPQRMPSILSEYRSGLAKRGGTLDALSAAAASLSAPDMENAAALAHALDAAVSAAPEVTPHFRKYDDETARDLPQPRDVRFFRPAFGAFMALALVAAAVVSAARWNLRVGAPSVGGERCRIAEAYDGPVRRVAYLSPSRGRVVVYAQNETLENVADTGLEGYLTTTARSVYIVETADAVYTYDGRADGKSWSVGRFDVNGFTVGALITARSGESVREWRIYDYGSLSDDEQFVTDAITALRNYEPLGARLYPAIVWSALVAAALWALFLRRITELALKKLLCGQAND